MAFEDYDLPGVKTVNGIAELGGSIQGAWFKDADVPLRRIRAGELCEVSGDG